MEKDTTTGIVPIGEVFMTGIFDRKKGVVKWLRFLI